MVDWLTWPAELVLSAGGIVASWFVSKDSLSFVALQMGFALLVLAAVVSLFAYLPALVGYWRSRSQINRPNLAAQRAKSPLFTLPPPALVFRPAWIVFRAELMV